MKLLVVDKFQMGSGENFLTPESTEALYFKSLMFLKKQGN